LGAGVTVGLGGAFAGEDGVDGVGGVDGGVDVELDVAGGGASEDDGADRSQVSVGRGVVDDGVVSSAVAAAGTVSPLVGSLAQDVNRRPAATAQPTRRSPMADIPRRPLSGHAQVIETHRAAASVDAPNAI
jgi:hypothetical protein